MIRTDKSSQTFHGSGAQHRSSAGSSNETTSVGFQGQLGFKDAAASEELLVWIMHAQLSCGHAMLTV